MGYFDNIRFPYFNMQQLNLDWLLQTVKKIADHIPTTGGQIGDVLKKTADGAAWEPIGTVSMDIHGRPSDTVTADNDEIAFYDQTAHSNRKIAVSDFLSSRGSDDTPAMDGTADAGTSEKFARGDHVHPSDTSRVPMSWMTNNALQISHGGTGATSVADANNNLGSMNISVGTNIPANSDLDTYTSTGTYYVATQADAATIANMPATVSGCKLIVMIPTVLPFHVQVAIMNNINSDIYIRWHNGTSWTVWNHMLTSAHTVSVAQGGTGATTATAAMLALAGLDLDLGTPIGGTDDLNTYMTPGVYYIVSSTNLTNAPSTSLAFSLIVKRSVQSNRYYQIALMNTAVPTIMLRNYTGSGWSAWRTLALASA